MEISENNLWQQAADEVSAAERKKKRRKTVMAMFKMTNTSRGTECEIFLIGRLDANNANEAENELLRIGESHDSIILNFKDLEYVSSAGLRALKRLRLTMKKKNGKLVLTNVNKAVMEIFQVTGFAGIFNYA